MSGEGGGNSRSDDKIIQFQRVYMAGLLDSVFDIDGMH